MVVLPNCGDVPKPPSAEGRRIVVSHCLPLRVVPNPDAPYDGFDFFLDPEALSFKNSRGLPGNVVFVGTLPEAAASVPASEELAAHLLDRFSCIPVFLDTELHTDLYHVFCLNYLQQMFDGRSCCMEFTAELYQAYIAANTRFAERVWVLIRSPDEGHVYIHDDYHLLTLPRILRQRSPSFRIYFTIHSHFPDSDILCSGPIAKDLVCNLLNADLLAFAASYCCSSLYDSLINWRSSSVEAFRSTCSRILNLSYQHSGEEYTTIDYLDRTVVVQGINASGDLCRLRKMLFSPKTAAIVKEISNKCIGRKLLLDVEDDGYFCCNHSMNLQAMEKLLESQTELRGQVVLVKIIKMRGRHNTDLLANRDRINSRFGFPGYEPVVVLDDPPMHELLALYTLADVLIAETLSTEKFIRYTACQQEGPVAHLPASAPRNGTIIGTPTLMSSLWNCSPWLPSGAIRVNSHDGMAMADAMGLALRMNEEEKQLLQEKTYMHVLSKYDIGYWAQSFEHDLQRALKDHQSAKILTRSSGKQTGPFSLDFIFGDKVSPQKLNKTTLEMAGMKMKKASSLFDLEGLFFLGEEKKNKPSLLIFEKHILSMNNNPEYHRAGMYTSSLQDYVDMVLPQALIKASTVDLVRILKATMCSDPNSTMSSVSGRSKDKHAMWLELHKLMSAHHGYSTR